MKMTFCNLILIIFLSVIFACNKTYKKNEILGTYISSKRMPTRDTIIFLDTINYIHYGINSKDNSKYSDTAKWDYNKKKGYVLLYDFSSQRTSNKKSKPYRSTGYFDVEKQKGMLRLVVGREAGWYYERQK